MMLGVSDGMVVIAMDVSVQHRHVLERGQYVHHVVAVAGEPLPVGFQVEERTVGEYHDRCLLMETRQVFLQPCDALSADFGPRAGYVIECNKMHTVHIKRVA